MSLLIPKEYTELVNRLRKEGYILHLTKRLDRYYWEITGNNIFGGFCTPSEETHETLSGQIAVDNEGCFDKWRKCPIILPIPENEKQLDFLIEQMKYFGTEEGYDVSNEYDFDRYVHSYDELN